MTLRPSSAQPVRRRNVSGVVCVFFTSQVLDGSFIYRRVRHAQENEERRSRLPPSRRRSRRRKRSKQDILAVATEEFAINGLSGARVDQIAERTRTSKRMIYYYFGGKEGLYQAVLEKAYMDIRSAGGASKLLDMEPRAAMRKLIELTFDYDETHPQFISLVSVENIHRAKHLTNLDIDQGRERERHTHAEPASWSGAARRVCSAAISIRSTCTC